MRGEPTGWKHAHNSKSAGEISVKVLNLAEFDLHLDLVPVNGLREQLDMDALLIAHRRLEIHPCGLLCRKNTPLFISDSLSEAIQQQFRG